MNIGKLIVAVVLLAVPAWLLLRVWRKYFALGTTPQAELFQMKTGVTLVSLTSGAWLSLFVLMILENPENRAGWVAKNLSPSMLSLFNLLLCGGSLVCSGLGRPSLPRTRSLRKAIAACAAFLMVDWLFLLANPH